MYAVQRTLFTVSVHCEPPVIFFQNFFLSYLWTPKKVDNILKYIFSASGMGSDPGKLPKLVTDLLVLVLPKSSPS